MCATATATFAANFPEAHVVTSRLEDLSIKRFKATVGRIDILLASPECRNHTCAKGSAPRDASSRTTAMLVVEYASALRPRWLVLENERRLSTGHGNGGTVTGVRRLTMYLTGLRSRRDQQDLAVHERKSCRGEHRGRGAGRSDG